MKIKNLITFVLLFVLSFSIVHEYVFTFMEDGHSSVSEYVCELETPPNYGDICDIHFEYHQAYLLSDTLKIADIEEYKSLNFLQEGMYSFHTNRELFRPPII